MSSAINNISSGMFLRRQEKVLNFSPPVISDELTIVLDTPQNWVANGNTIDATTGDVIYIPFGNAYTHASATVRQLPDDCTFLNSGFNNGNLDDSNTKYVFASSRVNSILSIPVTRDAYIETGTVPSTPVETGDTAQAGAARSITLAATSSAVDDAYNGMGITITSGTGSGQNNTVQDYNGTTKVATMRNNWDTTPDNTSVYDIANGTIVVQGGKNLRFIGGDYTSGTDADRDYGSNRACLRTYDQTESVYIENAIYDCNQSYGRDGFEYGGTNGVKYLPDIYLQNTMILNADSEYSKPGDPTNFVHADLFQPYGKHRFIFIDRLTGTTQYQGGFDDPQHFGLDRIYYNINVKYLDNTAPDSEDAGFLAYFKNSSASAITQLPFYNFHISNFYVQDRYFFGTEFANSSVFPQSTASIVGSSGYISDDSYTGRADGYVEFPPILGVYGAVQQASDYGGALFGDYVVADRDAGVGVRTLSKTDSRSFYHKTDDCHLWLYGQSFFLLNSSVARGTFGTVDVTSIQDISHKYNDMSATNVKYHIRSHYGRPLFDFQGNAFIDTDVETLGTTSLFADNSDAFFVYVVATCDDDGYILSKSGANEQFALYVSSGSLYGLCRGESTLIKESWDGSMAFIAANWDGTNLTYYFNSDSVDGTVGSNSADTGQNIIFGAGNNGASSFFDGAIWGGRIYDVSVSDAERSDLFYYENLYANILGLGGSRPDVPSIVQNVVATPTSSQIGLAFDAPASDGGSDILDYIVRYSTDEVNWSYWQLTTVSATTGATITGLSSATTYYYEIYPVNVAGWGVVYEGSATTS